MDTEEQKYVDAETGLFFSRLGRDNLLQVELRRCGFATLMKQK